MSYGGPVQAAPDRFPTICGTSFVHLRTHTEFSVVDGTLRIPDAAAAARADQQPALAITDLCKRFGAIKFYKACRSQGVKPIIGTDVFMAPDPASSGGASSQDRQASRLLLLVQHRQGYLNLCELLARVWVKNVQRSQAWLKWQWLDELGSGLIALSGADFGAVGTALLAGETGRARSAPSGGRREVPWGAGISRRRAAPRRLNAPSGGRRDSAVGAAFNQPVAAAA